MAGMGMTGSLGGSTLGTAVVVFKAVTKDFDASVKKMADLTKSFSDGLDKAGRTISKVGRDALVLGGALAAPLAAGVKGAADFDQAFRQVQTIMGETNDKEIAQLKRGLRELSILMGDDIVGVTRGLYQALSSGVPKENSLTFIQEAAKAAKAGTTDLFTAVDVLTTVINSYGAEVISATEASDIMFKAVEAGKTEFPDLAAQIGEVASTAALAGISFEELAGFVATMTATGVNTAETVTALNQLLLAFIKPGEEAAKVSKALGIEMSASALRGDGLRVMLEKIRDATDNQIESIVQLFPNIRALKGALVSGAQDGKVLADTMEKMAGAAGSTDRAFKIMQEGMTARFNQMVEQGKALARELAISLFDALKSDIDALKAKLQELQAWMDENPEQVKQTAQAWYDLTKTILGVGVALTVVGKLLEMTSSLTITLYGLVKVLPYLRTGFAFVVTQLGKLAGVFGVVRTVGVELAAMVVRMTAAFGTAGLAASLGTVALIITGVASGLYTLYQAIRTLQSVWSIQKTFDDTAEAVKRAAERMDMFGGRIKKLYEEAQTNNPYTRLRKEAELYEAMVDELSIEVNNASERDQGAIRDVIEQTKLQRAEVEVLRDAYVLMSSKTIDAVEAVSIAQHDLSDATLNNIAMMNEEAQTQLAALAETYTKEGKTLTDDVVANFKVMSDAEKKALEHTKTIADERKKVDDASVEQRKALLNEAIQANNIEKISEEERLAALHVFKNNEVTLVQAVGAIKHNMTAEEINLLEKGLAVEEVVAQRKKQLREGDAADLAQKMAQNKEVYNAYVEAYKAHTEELLKSIAETRTKRAELSKDDAMFSQKWQQLRREEAALQDELARMQSENYQLSQDVARARVELVREELGITSELTTEQMKAAEAQETVTAARLEAYKTQYEAIIGSLGKLSETYNNLDANQKAFIDARIADQLAWLNSTNATAEGTKQAVAIVTNEVRTFLGGIEEGQLRTAESTKLAADTMAQYGPAYKQHAVDLQTIANAQFFYVQQLDVVRDKIASHQQAIDNWNASGQANVAIIEEHNKKIAALRVEEERLVGITRDLSSAQGTNITTMVALKEQTAERLRQLDEQMAKMQAEGKNVDKLRQEYNLLSAQYNVVTNNLKQAGAVVGDLAIKQAQEANSASRAADAQQEHAEAANTATKAIDTQAKVVEDLPKRTDAALQQTGSIWSRFLGWLEGIAEQAWRNIWSWFDPQARHSPSAVDTIIEGQKVMADAWQKHINFLLDMFKTKHAKQLEMLKQFGEPLKVQFGRDSNDRITSAHIINAPVGFTEQDAVRMQNDLDRINQAALKAGAGFSVTLQTILSFLTQGLTSVQAGNQGNMQAGTLGNTLPGQLTQGSKPPFSRTELPPIAPPMPKEQELSPLEQRYKAALSVMSPQFKDASSQMLNEAGMSPGSVDTVSALSSLDRGMQALARVATSATQSATHVAMALTAFTGAGTGDVGFAQASNSAAGTRTGRAFDAQAFLDRLRNKPEAEVDQSALEASMMQTSPVESYALVRQPWMTDEDWEAYKAWAAARRRGGLIPNAPKPKPKEPAHTGGSSSKNGKGNFEFPDSGTPSNVTINANLMSTDQMQAFINTTVQKHLRDSRRKNI